MKNFTLLFLLSLGLNSAAQWRLSNQYSVQSHPENLLFNSFWIDNTDHHWPLRSADLRGTYQWGERWRGEAALNYKQTRIVTPFSETSFPDETDPFYGFVRDTKESSNMNGNLVDVYQWLGLEAGAAFRLNESRKHQFWLPAGLQLMLPLMPYSRYGDGEASSSWPGNKLHLLAFYGLYLRPTYQFTFGRRASSPWALEIFGNADLLMRAEADNNPHFIYGGGIGVMYRLNYR